MSIEDTLVAERAKYGERLTPAQAIALLRSVVAGNPEYGLLAKPSGNAWDGYAIDIIAHRGGDQHYDVLIDAPDASTQPPYNGTSRPAWQAKGPYDPARFVAVEGDPVPVPQPQPDPPAPQPDYDAKIRALTELVSDFGKTVSKQREEMLALAERVEVIAGEVKVLQAPRKVKTSQDGWGPLRHSHEVSV